MNVFTCQLDSVIEDIPQPSFDGAAADLLLVYGSRHSLEEKSFLEKLRQSFPNAALAGCSSAGEIANGVLHFNSVVVAALDFKRTQVKTVRVDAGNAVSHEAIGEELVSRLDSPDLRLMMIFSDGLSVDCDEVVTGIKKVIGDRDIPVFGGLAGDSMEWTRTVVLDDDGAHGDAVVALGLYGEELEVRASSSAFDIEGSDHEVTRSDGNLVYEVDGRPAVSVLREVLGDQADALPGISIKFPLILIGEDGSPTLCRAPIEISEEHGTIMFAGSVPEGPVRFLDMRDPKLVINDAVDVAGRVQSPDAEFALIVNCGARRCVLGACAEHLEPDSIQRVLGKELPTIGFYSYGEIAAGQCSKKTELHNNTVSIVSLNEA